MTITNKDFQKEFKVNNNKDVEQFAQFIKCGKVLTVDQFNMRQSIINHIEHSYIFIQPQGGIKFKQFTNQMALNAFNNIDNRLQQTLGLYIIIIHRVSDNKIITIPAVSNNNAKIQQALIECSDGNEYNLIIFSPNKYNLGDIKLRTLIYYYKYPTERVQLTLKYPQRLISLTIRNVQLTNMNECINLRNLTSDNNYYTKQDISGFTSLQRFTSWRDRYQNLGSCLLQDLLKSNKLKFVFIDNEEGDSNIVGSFTMNKNIDSLQCLKIKQAGIKYDMNIDLSGEFPQFLRLFSVTSSDNARVQHPDEIRCGRITGPRALVKRLKDNLINQYDDMQ